jgi:hypothetical protein
MQFVDNWKAFAGGWAPFLDEAECCLWRTLFLDGGNVPIIEAGYRPAICERGITAIFHHLLSITY